MEKEYALNFNRLSVPEKRKKIKTLFGHMDLPDYVILWTLYSYADEKETDRVYIDEIATKLSMPRGRVLRLVREMQRKGILVWEHDEKGVYILFPENAMQKANTQKDVLHSVYEQVATRYGKENLQKLIAEMRTFDNILEEEIDNLSE
jgi:DNA-binding MarR family transcriptional regulator